MQVFGEGVICIVDFILFEKDCIKIHVLRLRREWIVLIQSFLCSLVFLRFLCIFLISVPSGTNKSR